MAEIILIGPVGVGKSTQGRLLAERLGVPQISLDDWRWTYYAEVGYDKALADQIRQTQGFPALLDYWKRFNVHAVERVLADHHDCVIDFGAGHSIYEDDEEFKRIQQVLAPYEHVILLLPSADPVESIQILTDRQQKSAPVADRGVIGGIIERHVYHHSNRDLAKMAVYTKGKTPEETCEELLSRLNLN